MQHQKQFIRRMAAVLITKAIDMNNKRNMKNCLALMVVLLSALLLSATVSGAERMRIIIDTDARAELDDQHAIAYALFSGNHFEVEGITVNRGSDGYHRTDRDRDIDDHFEEAEDMVKLCASWGKFPVIKGASGYYHQIKGNINESTFDGSDAVNFIIERAHAPSDRPLIIYAIGNLTHVALALLKDPTIAPKIEIWWLGTRWPRNQGENNQVGDLDAFDALLENPQNVAFNILPYMSCPTGPDRRERMRGKGPQVSPAVSTRRGSLTCFGDFSASILPGPDAKGRTLLDAAGLGIFFNKSWYAPQEKGAPSFVRTDPDWPWVPRHNGRQPYPGYWVANDSNPRRVTFWLKAGDTDEMLSHFYNTFDNWVLADGP